MARRLLLPAIMVAACALAACGGSDGDRAAGAERPPIRFGTKNFTEQFVLGHLYAKALEAKGFRVELKQDLGSSEIVDRALTGGGIDAYAEYTGVIVQELAGQQHRPRSAQETYRRAKAFQEDRGFHLLEATPGSDSLAHAVLPRTARRHGLQSTADLERLGRFRYGGPPENELRFQGAAGVRRVYGLDFEYVPLDISKRYEALNRGRVDVVDVFTTEGQLADKTRYKVLADPEGIFGYQHIVPVVRASTVREQGPDFVRTMNAVSALLTNDALRRMNGAVDLRGQEPSEVAERFLRDQDLL